MKRGRPVRASRVGCYPPLYYSLLREAARQWWTWFSVITALTLVAGSCFIWEWSRFLMPFAPLLGAVWIYSVSAALFSRRDNAIVRVLPYFLKKGPRVDADTFLYGLDIARNFQILEAVAKERGTTPLSTFGWNDDLAGQTLVWHEAVRGIESVTALLEHPELAAKVREDLERLLSALQKAHEVGTPFCLLLRIGDFASGAEMDARQGTFF